MHIPDITYHKPLSIEEACRILRENPEGVPLAGGTDLLVEIKMEMRSHTDFVSLNSIPELKKIVRAEDSLVIGAAVTHNEIAGSSDILEFCPVLSEAVSQIGTDQIRNTGTVGGNLCTGASCCDSAPVLIALNADVRIVGVDRDRKVPLKDFFVSHKKTLLEKGEILTEILVPRPEPGLKSGFEKFGLREAASISVVSAAFSIRVLPSGGCVDPCVVLGAVAPIPIISTSAQQLLTGHTMTELVENADLLEKVSEGAALDSLPIDDIRGSADYRREIVKVLVKRLILKSIN